MENIETASWIRIMAGWSEYTLPNGTVLAVIRKVRSNWTVTLGNPNSTTATPLAYQPPTLGAGKATVEKFLQSGTTETAPETTKKIRVRMVLTLEVDAAGWTEDYGVEGTVGIRSDVKQYVATTMHDLNPSLRLIEHS